MKSKKFVLAGLALLAITGLLALAGCKNDSVPEPTRYTVKFETAHGTAPADITVVSGTKLTAEQLKGLTDTADYIFDGWYDGENKAEGGTYTVTKDVTLVAKWRERGVTAEVSFSVDENGRVVLSSETKDAVIYYTINGSGPDENSSKYGEPIEISAQTTVRAYAQGTGMKPSDVVEKTYLVVTFNADGGSEVVPQIVESGNAATKPTDPTKANWVFAGWYTLKDDGETLADTAYSFDTPVEGDIILYAAWNGRGSDGNIVLKNKVMSKTSEVQVSTGTFKMGSNAEGVDENEKPAHDVTISKGYFMGRHEVTQQLYFAVMGKNPSYFKTGTENEEPKEGERELPVETVSWYDAVVFCNELTKKVLDDGACVYYSDAGFTAVYTTGDGASKKTPYMDISKSGYRLPTEAEWEYAARAGDDTTDKITWSGTDTKTKLKGYAWYTENSGNEAGEEKKTHQVGTLASNAWGLHDMSGNVWEWCWDWYGDYSTESVTNPTGPTGGSSGDIRVCRGGCWNDNADYCTVSRRYCYVPNRRDSSLGFRLVRSAN